MKSKKIISSVIVVLLTLNILLFAVPTAITSYAEGINASSSNNSLPSEYCMRDEYMVLAQNQDSHGYCWNFAATMAASTTLMKATGEYYDFSELWTGVSLNNATNSHQQIGSGGSFSNQQTAIKQSGLMLECDLPYQYSYTVSSENSADYYNFYEKYSNDDLASCLVSDGDSSFSRTEVEEIKKHIYNHGSIYLTFVFRTGFLESDGAYYLTPNQKNTNSNHAVSVIGWDDNYQKEFYLDGSDTPTVFKGAWIILNSYTEKNGNDGLSFVFYNDNNIGSVQGYRYEPDTSRELYFYDKIESGYSYPSALKGKYYGDFTAESCLTKQKNIFYDDVNLEYSYTVSKNAEVEKIDIYLGDRNVTDDFNVSIDNKSNRFYISKNNASYGQYKVLVTYGNGEKSDTYLNNFFVTHGLVGEEIEYDYANNSFDFNPGRDLEFYSFMLTDKDYIIYTNKLSGEIVFLPTEQSVYSEKNMSIPNISYEITNGKSCTKTYTITSNSGYELTYNFTFEYYGDKTLEPVNVYYNLGGGINNSKNYSKELANSENALTLYAPTRPGYTFAGWYLDYGNGSKKVPEKDGVYYISWDDIHHMGEAPNLRASSYYKQYYNNSNTVFVYAHWEEEEYHTVDISIIGKGTSQINKSILISSRDTVRYLFNPSSGNALSNLKINGVDIKGNAFIEAAKYGLALENVDRDISITATFDEGVYLSLKHGENVKSAYVVGTYNGQTKKFYDGDFIPKEFFSSPTSRPTPIIRPFTDKTVNDLLKNDIIDKIDREFIIRDDLVKDDVVPDKFKDINDLLDDENSESNFDVENRLPIIFPGFGTYFTLIVEVYDDEEGYTYVLDDVNSYSVLEKGVFKKTVAIKSGSKIAEISVASAVKKPIEKIEINYTVGTYIQDHYISSDINADSGDKNSAVYDAGQVVYLFVKTQSDTFMYHFRLSDHFEQITKDGWYRAAIYVNPNSPDLGRISASRELQKYTVTWKNWNGSVIYTETYSYGSLPKFNNRYSDIKSYPVRADDDKYSYIFAGWDKPIRSVNSDVTYTATYDAILRRYVIHVEPTENGSVTPDGNNYMNRYDRHTYTFTPNPGYKVKDVLINGESVGAVPSYTFSDVTCDQTVKVEFEKLRLPVNIILGENGSADLSGVVEVEYGTDVTVNITPNNRFGIDFIKVNGLPTEVSNTLLISNVTGDTVIEIAFKQTVFNIETSSAGKGAVTPSFTVSSGENAPIDFNADIFFKVKDVKIDGVSIGKDNNYTLINVTSDHTVSVEYELDILMIVIASLASGALIVFAISIIPMIKKRRRYLCLTKRPKN